MHGNRVMQDIYLSWCNGANSSPLKLIERNVGDIRYENNGTEDLDGARLEP